MKKNIKHSKVSKAYTIASRKKLLKAVILMAQLNSKSITMVENAVKGAITLQAVAEYNRQNNAVIMQCKQLVKSI